MKIETRQLLTDIEQLLETHNEMSHEVELVLAKRMAKDSYEYLLLWKGYPAIESSWSKP